MKKEEDNLLEVFVNSALEEILYEGNQPKVSVTVNGKQVNFGSSDHISHLQGLLGNLEQLKNCYKKGTANRHVYSISVSKLRKLIKSLLANSNSVEKTE